MSSIAENLSRLNDHIPEGVTLIAISKTKPVSDILEAYEAGQRNFGENRIQEMADKYAELPKDINWHMVGHVQGNKIKYMASFVHMVHGIDKPKRLKELNKEAAKNDRVINCLIQVHIAEEESKFGFSYDEAYQVLKDNPAEKYSNLRIRGLMGMATFTGDTTKVRKEFRGLKMFFDQVKSELNPDEFNTLSMGMSGDYQVAIEEGSNMVRIGQAIFGERNQKI